MTNINITNFRKDIYELLEQTIKFNEPINLLNTPGMKEKLIKGKETKIEDCVAEEEVEW